MAGRTRAELEQDAALVQFLQGFLIEMHNNSGLLQADDFIALYEQVTDPTALAVNRDTMESELESPLVNTAFHLYRAHSNSHE